MITTANLGLTVWDTEEDEFEHSQLANNFVAIDAHDHEGGLSAPLEEPAGPESELPEGHWTNLEKGLPIGTRAIKPASIWRYLIAYNAVGHLQIGKEEVWARNIKKLNVEEPHIKDEAVSTRTIEEAAVTIDKLDPNILALGTITLWFKWSTGAKPGDLWHVCDGTVWADIPNDMGLTEGAIPDLRGRFIRGTTQAASDGSERGGNAAVDLSHHHNFNTGQFEHSHAVPGHSHTIATDGNHHHSFVGGHILVTRKNALVDDPFWIEGEEPTPDPDHQDGLKVRHLTDKQSLYLANNEGEYAASDESPKNAGMDDTGFHNHGGSTALSPGFSTGGQSIGSVNITTDTQLAAIDTTPPFTGFCYIMLVRNTGT